MRYLLNLLLLTLLTIIQTTFLPAVLPWFAMYPAFIMLIILSLRFQRNYVLIAALWAGLVQDTFVGETFGLYMLVYFVALFVAVEIKEGLLESNALIGGLRLAVATIIHEGLILFAHYIWGVESGLFTLFQISAGTTLLANFLLYAIFLLVLRLKGKEKIVLGERQ